MASSDAFGIGSETECFLAGRRDDVLGFLLGVLAPGLVVGEQALASARSASASASSFSIWAMRPSIALASILGTPK